MAEPISIADLRRLARRRLPRMVFDYLEGGAEDEGGIVRNVEAFRKIRLMPHRLVDVSERSTAVELLGKKAAAPIVVGPTGLNGAFWPNGDIALARAAAKAGVPFALSTASNATIENVAAVGGRLWFQLYVVHRELAANLVRRASQAGCEALILTVDVPVNGKRERDLRNGFQMPLRYSPRTIFDILTHPRWASGILASGALKLANLATTTASSLDAQTALLRREMDASFCWDDLARLRDVWPRRLIVKGICAPHDAARCFEIGADAVVVSNHGGRQLDDAPAPISILESFQGLGPVLIDGGIRRGSDIVKALASGAHGVLVGRSILYGLAARGETGATKAISILVEEIDRTLALVGCPDASRLSSAFVGHD
ncbi:alpha-hydroxy-acid oxidizing protein [Bradyrhizobium manausense]|uniref:alpha-hydroxy-acid oxidizing protein n=1 Tax=Bradyrhizobium manausense TaxID=989370 RepID=UPI001BA6D994|nr:alpha-hydroxy-acid oxidizing protein [Bradyrhizobium manausense]MBR0725579.1 alpha-hydroxy-acid oxidizing protein [Bradyrhizobium manausense]